MSLLCLPPQVSCSSVWLFLIPSWSITATLHCWRLLSLLCVIIVPLIPLRSRSYKTLSLGFSCPWWNSSNSWCLSPRAAHPFLSVHLLHQGVLMRFVFPLLLLFLLIGRLAFFFAIYLFSSFFLKLRGESWRITIILRSTKTTTETLAVTSLRCWKWPAVGFLYNGIWLGVKRSPWAPRTSGSHPLPPLPFHQHRYSGAHVWRKETNSLRAGSLFINDH